MNVYYRNALKTSTLSMTNTVSGETSGDIIQQDLERTVSCTGSSSVITAQWSVQAAHAADTLFVSNTNALQGTLKLYNQNQALTRTIALQLGRWNNKITFPALAVGKMELTLQAPAGANLYAGLLCLDLAAALPRFAMGVDMSDTLRGTGSRSDSGQTYGMAGVTLETFTAPWKRVTNEEREAMRRYIEAVQLDTNHYISPYEGIDMYVTITARPGRGQNTTATAFTGIPASNTRRQNNGDTRHGTVGQQNQLHRMGAAYRENHFRGRGLYGLGPYQHEYQQRAAGSPGKPDRSRRQPLQVFRHR
jgi:hypothetical protein